MSRINKTIHVSWHATCTCKIILDAGIFDKKQRWNIDKNRCEYKELIDKGRTDNGFIWNPSICKCDCNKSCNIGQYLEYKNCKCRKNLTDKLVEECSEDIDGNGIIHNATSNDNGKVCKSCTVYIVLLTVTLIIIIGK